jgi:DNA-binding response OmpR family regulator
MKKTVLLIEDELILLNILASYFKKNNFNVITAVDGLSGLEKYRIGEIDIVCTDIMLPNIDGWEIVRSIRKHNDVPILMMTALDTEQDQLKGYEYMVDDYITKPFSPAVLVAKVKSILRRTSPENPRDSRNIYKLDDFKINFDARELTINDELIHLSKTEFDLLAFLVKNINHVMDRSTILDEVWGMDVYVEERVIDTNIKVIRKKIGAYSKNIVTSFGIGYKFDDKLH